MSVPSLHEALAAHGYTSEPAIGLKQYARRILKGADVVGTMTAHEAWSFLALVDEDGFPADESVATHELVNIRIAPGPKGLNTIMRPRGGR